MLFQFDPPKMTPKNRLFVRQEDTVQVQHLKIHSENAEIGLEETYQKPHRGCLGKKSFGHTGIRTRAIWVNAPTLYQLSYGPWT